MNKPFMQSFIHTHDCLCSHVHDECVVLLCSFFFVINVGCLKDFEKHSIKINILSLNTTVKLNTFKRYPN